MNQNNDHGKEMMSLALEDVMTQNDPASQPGVSPYTLVVEYSDGDRIEIPCLLTMLAPTRTDLDKIPIRTGLLLFKNSFNKDARYTLKAYDMTFSLQKSLLVSMLYDDVCSITFSHD